MYRLQNRKVFGPALPAFFTQASFSVTALLDLIMVGAISPAAIAAG
jgi:Na+-driven multidrug efflux pump